MDITADKINEIRRKADNPMVDCPTCGHRATAPYRSHNQQGRIVQGCVDAFHADRIISPSASFDWHNSKAARAIRRKTLNALTNK